MAAVATKLFDRQFGDVEAEGTLQGAVRITLNQIRSIDLQRFVARLGTLKPETMERVDRALQISVGLLEL